MLAAAVAAMGIFATAAVGQDAPNPFATGEQVVEEQRTQDVPVPDSDFTPVAKDGSRMWKQIGGAKFARAGSDQAEVSEGITRYDDNLFAVSFRGPQYGLVGGARCGDPEDSSDFLKSHPDSEADCRPVLYSYTDDPTEGRFKEWREVELPGGSEPGYVGAIAWIDDDRALAVGGTGTFPRREPPYDATVGGRKCNPPDAPALSPYGAGCDQAGMGRAWLMRADGSWCELKPGSLGAVGEAGCPALPKDDSSTPRFEGVRGLTAVDFKRQVEGGDPEEIGFVGALGQMWRWTADETSPEGGFDRLYDAHSEPEDLKAIGGTGLNSDNRPSSSFRFRVRAIRFRPTPETVGFAVTSGCCAASEPDNKPFLFVYQRRNVGSATLHGWDIGGVGTDSSPRPTQAPEPESFYSLVTRRPHDQGKAASVLASTARNDQPALEPRSQVICEDGYRPLGPLYVNVPGAIRLSTARFVAIDGSTPSFGCSEAPEWAVGEVRSEQAAGRGRRGLLNTPRTADRTPPPTDVPQPLKPTVVSHWPSEMSTYAQGQLEQPHAPTDEGRARAHLASLDLLSESYSLNAVDVVGGTGFAVGDHGGVLVLSSSEAREDKARSEPDGPELGSGGVGGLADRSAFDELRAPSPEGVGGVPTLASRPRDRLEEPALFGWGSPDASIHSGAQVPAEDVSELAMSRDGSEGWAVGTHPQIRRESAGFNGNAFHGVMSLYRFDGAGWRRCDPVGVPGQLAADRACASLVGLRSYRVGNELRRVQLTSVARVPLERDGNPDNDEEFEAVAIGSNYRGPEQPAVDDPVILRYRKGEWGFEPRGRRLAISSHAFDAGLLDEPEQGSTGINGNAGSLMLKDVVFTAPDDGWILATQPTSGYDEIHRLFHFDGAGWEECVRAEGSCASLRVPRRVRSARLRLTGAGDRVYLYGHRIGAGPSPMNIPVAGETVSGTLVRPLVLYRARGEDSEWTDGSGEDGDGAGFDPGCERMETVNEVPECVPAAGAGQGQIFGLSVTERDDGGYEGLAVGKFRDYAVPPTTRGLHDPAEPSRDVPVSSILMRLSRDGDRYRWETFREPGALEDHMWPGITSGHYSSDGARMAMVPPVGDGPSRALVGQWMEGRLFGWEPGRERFELVGWDMPLSRRAAEASAFGIAQAVTPDGDGGAWVAARNLSCDAAPCHKEGQTFFYRYTDRPHRPVFEEVPHPLGARPVDVTAAAGARDGTLWMGTNSGTLARYDRLTGWETVRVPGWEPGAVVTRESPVHAVAVGDDGRGVAVGERGRVVNLAPGGVELDAASRKRCVDDPAPPCGTGRDLRAAAVGPDGSVLVGGDAMTVLWRGPTDGFQAVAKPQGSDATRITGVSLPTPTRAYLVTGAGFVYRGDMTAPGVWGWRTENLNRRTVVGSEIPLRAVAVDADGRGYAVGDQGVVLYRDGDGNAPWRRLRGPGTDDLTAVALPRGDGDAVLIGGRNGVIWTGEGDRLAVARPADFFRNNLPQYADSPGQGPQVGPVVGLALLPGVEDGQVEAWAAVQARGAGTNRLYHYTSDESEPLLNPERRVEALPDTPAERDGELRLAAFGKSDCASVLTVCSPMQATLAREEVVARRVAEELRERAEQIDMSLFTGDVSDSAGYPSGKATEGLPIDSRTGYPVHNDPYQYAFLVPSGASWEAFVGRLKFRRWSEMVADPLDRADVPVFGTAGPGDLSRPYYNCSGFACSSVTEPAKTGENMAWRTEMERRRAPWGNGELRELDQGLTFTPTVLSDGSQRLPDVKVDPDGDGFLDGVEARGGASTHYATEVERGGRKVARLVVVDTSLRSLSASDAIQNPVEQKGQLRWLERMLCFQGQVPTGGEGQCTREPGQEAIVLSNTPTYSYGPGAADGTQADGAEMERTLIRYKASVVVSGRLGWSGRYWATAPGLHEPCLGDGYRDTPPEPGTRICGRGEADLPVAAAIPGADALTGGASLGPPPPPVAEAQREVEKTAGELNPTGLVPFVVAAGAGGKFGPNGENSDGEGRDGFFHGYSIVRVDQTGDPRGVIVEQRPVLDWLSLTATQHVLRPGQRMKLRGIGREPIGFEGSTPATRYDTIDTAAITHRYDLVLADPQKPYLPLTDANGDYVPVPAAVATVDRTTGAVRAGRGATKRTYTLAVLSVDDKAATWPIAFEPRRSFVPARTKVTLPPLPRPARAPAAQQAIRLAEPPPPPPPPPATPASPFTATTLQPPEPPGLPQLPSATLPPTPAPPQLQAPPPPPLPPAPPSVPPQQQPLPLALNAKLQPISIVPSVNPPAPPPVNPAPPAGGAARKEAKQRQAAAAKSEEGSSGEQAQQAGGDLAQQPGPPDGAQATRRAVDKPAPASRRAQDRPTPSFSSLARPDQASAWARGSLYGAGLGLTALAAALGFSILRPRPRRREPRLPAPALASARRRQR